jgi:hypothetical protein
MCHVFIEEKKSQKKRKEGQWLRQMSMMYMRIYFFQNTMEPPFDVP